MIAQKQTNIIIYIIVAMSVCTLLYSVASPSTWIEFLVFAFISIGLLKPELLFPVYFIASLCGSYFVAAEGVGYKRLMGLAILGGFIFRLAVIRKALVGKWIIYCSLVFVVTLASTLIAYDSNMDGLLVMGLNIFIFITISNLSLNKDEFNRLLFSIFIAVIITTLYFAVHFWIDPGFLKSGRLTIGTRTSDINENRFAMMMAQMAAYSFGYILFSKKGIVKLICLISIFLNTYFVLQSGSRSAFIGICVGIVIISMVFYYIRTSKMMIFGLGILGLLIIFLFVHAVDLYPMVARRMDVQAVMKSGGTGRWERIVAELEYIIPKHPIFGVGLGANNEQLALASYVANPGSSHNFFVSALAQMGFLGFAIYMIFYWKIIKGTISQCYNYEVMVIPLSLIIVAILNGIGEVIYTERLFWNALALAGLGIATYSDKNVKLQHWKAINRKGLAIKNWRRKSCLVK